MSVIVTKAIDENDYRIGTIVAGVTKQGSMHSYGGAVANDGVALLNTRWGSRFTTPAPDEE